MLVWFKGQGKVIWRARHNGWSFEVRRINEQWVRATIINKAAGALVDQDDFSNPANARGWLEHELRQREIKRANPERS